MPKLATVPFNRILCPIVAVVSLLTVSNPVNALQRIVGHKTWGKASYYTVKSCQREGTSGVWTASGERYDESALTCALPSRPFGGFYQVCSQQQPTKCIVVKHTDYGPGRNPRSRGVIIDLTPRGFLAVCGALKQGLCQVSIEPL